MTLTSACPLLNSFPEEKASWSKRFLFFCLQRPCELQGLKNGRDLELRFASLCSSYSLLFPIQIIPKVCDLKKKTTIVKQFYTAGLFAAFQVRKRPACHFTVLQPQEKKLPHCQKVLYPLTDLHFQLSNQFQC